MCLLTPEVIASGARHLHQVTPSPTSRYLSPLSFIPTSISQLSSPCCSAQGLHSVSGSDPEAHSYTHFQITICNGYIVHTATGTLAKFTLKACEGTYCWSTCGKATVFPHMTNDHQIPTDAGSTDIHKETDR